MTVPRRGNNRGVGPRTPVRVDVAERRDGAVAITVSGELDVHTRLLLARALARHEDRRVLLDLRGVEFADSAGLTAVTTAASAAARAGGTVELVGTSDAIRRLLRLTRSGERLLAVS